MGKRMACIPRCILAYMLVQLFAEQVLCISDSNATFSKDFVSIKIEFNEVVKPINPYNGCPTIFNAVTLSKLGSSPICAFSFDGTLYVYPDKDGTINAGDPITFKADSILDQNSTAINSTSVITRSPISGAFAPNVVITEHGYISGCVQDRYFLSADLSLNSGYSYFSQFDWGLNIDNATSSEVTTAHNYLSGKAANASEVEIAKSVLSSNESVKIEISNIFGQNDSKIFMLKGSTQPAARIKGSRQIEIQETNELDFSANLILSKCGPSLSMASYNWSIMQTSGVPVTQVTDFVAADTLLFIKPFALKAGATYNVTLEISYTLSNNSTGLATDSVSVSVKTTAVFPEIVGGDRDIGKTQTLILIARDKMKSKASLGFMWSCKDVATGEMCKDKNRTASLTFGNSSVMSLSMAAGDFTVGKRYEFTVAITKDSETTFASIIVTIRSSTVSVVNVLSDRSQWTNDDKMYFRGVIQSDAANTNVNYQWKISQSNGQEVVIPSSNGSITTDHTSGTVPHNIIFTVPKNTLQPAYTYKVSLTAGAGAASSQGSMHQKIGIAPRHGHLEVMPKLGVAYHTTFRLRSFAWIDTDMHKPLRFRFGYVKDSKRRYLTAWRNYNVLSGTLLPSGNSLILFVEVRSSVGLVAERQVVVTVSSQMNANDASLVQYYEDVTKHRNYEKISTAVTGIVKSGLSDGAKRTHLGAYLNAVIGISLWPSLASVVSGTISDVVSAAGGSLLTPELKNDIASLTTKISSSLEKEMPGINLKASEAKQMLDIFEELIPDVASISSNDTNVISSFKNSSNIVAQLACRSVLHDSDLKSLNNSLVTISSGFSDFARDIDANSMISVSKAYRQKFFQNTCASSNYFKCAGLCWSMTSFKHEKYFQASGNIGEVMTLIHNPRVIDLHTGIDVAITADGKDLTVKLPITMPYNKSDSYVKCVMQDPVTLSWQGSYCRSSTVGETLNCQCTELYPVAGIKQMGVQTTSPPASSSSTSSGQGNGSGSQPDAPSTTTMTTSTGMSSSSTSPGTTTTPAPTAAPGDLITVVINANCTKYIMNEAAKSTFIDNFKTDVAAQINIDKSRITVWNVGCGSIIVNLTISAPPGGSSAPTKAAAMTSLQNLLSSGLMRVTISGAVIPAIVPGGTVKTLPPPTTVPTTLPFIPVVKTNWMPMMISFALILTLIISIALFCAWLHGRYYRKKQYTDINCNKPKPVKAEDAIENMNKKQRRLKLDTIMDDSIANAEVPAIIVAAPVSLKRTRGKSRISPTVMTNSRASSTSTFAASPRELPRLALDDTSSESEAETSFTNARPRSGATSAKSRASSRAQSSVSVHDRPKSSKSRPGTSTSRRDRPRSSRPGTTQSRHLRPETAQSRRSRPGTVEGGIYENRGADSSLGQGKIIYINELKKLHLHKSATIRPCLGQQEISQAC